MKTYLILLVALVLVAMVTVWVVAQPPAVRVQVQHAPLQGKVEVKPVAQLQRFPHPVTAVPPVAPPARDGHRWCWHPSYGWVALPLAVAPAQVLLPANYQLPQQVAVYQTAAATQCQGVCPHCGQPITLTLQ